MGYLVPLHLSQRKWGGVKYYNSISTAPINVKNTQRKKYKRQLI